MFTTILLSAYKAHLANPATTLQQKKKLLESIHNHEKWQECIAAIIDMTEDDVFQTEFSTDIASVDTSTLTTYEQTGAVTKELELRAFRTKLWESFEKWTQDMTCEDEHFAHPELVALRKKYYLCFMDRSKGVFKNKHGEWQVRHHSSDVFHNTEGEWEVWKFTSDYKNKEEAAAQNMVLYRIAMWRLTSPTSTYPDWLRTAFKYFVRYLGSEHRVYHESQFAGFVEDHCIKMIEYLKDHALTATIKEIIIQAYETYSNKVWSWPTWVYTAASVQLAVPEYADLYKVFEDGIRGCGPKSLQSYKWEMTGHEKWRHPPDDRMKAIMQRYIDNK